MEKILRVVVPGRGSGLAPVLSGLLLAALPWPMAVAQATPAGNGLVRAVPAAPVASGALGADAATLVQSARELLMAGKHAEALAQIAPVLADAATRTHGRAAYCAHDQVEALTYMGMAPQGATADILPGDDCDALYLRAFALTEMGQRADAVAALEQLTALSPAYPQYFVELGFAYRRAGQPQKAMAAYQQARQIVDDSGRAAQFGGYRAAALRGIGFLLFDAKDWDGAEAAYRASLKDDPDSRVAASELALIAKKRAAAVAVTVAQPGA
ncbi:tetratricopeptide repeat protein [Novosphingobium sp. FSY-8]|uniref:Tetratricopeptide repeat protein n=1 Tax=Novosphingobium ovatum TaxID=1908523 RepID=A0ABW9XAN0_9SPHN|nr:tetratricopeptide repeat protein [Novosphingobium ovatum]NBC35588.1 tetratricopeptide repeat protein [Novosphingobium ovatum]